MVTPPSSPHPPHPPTAATSHSVFTLKRTRKATCLRSLATRPVGVERPRVPASINSDFKIRNLQLFIPLLNPRSHIIFLPYVAHFLSKSSPTKPKIRLSSSSSSSVLKLGSLFLSISSILVIFILFRQKSK